MILRLGVMLLFSTSLWGMGCGKGYSEKEATSGKSSLANLHQSWQQKLYNPLSELITELSYYKNPLPSGKSTSGRKLSADQVVENLKEIVSILDRLSSGLNKMIDGNRSGNSAYHEKGRANRSHNSKERNKNGIIDYSIKMLSVLDAMKSEVLINLMEPRKSSWDLVKINSLKGDLSEVYTRAHYYGTR
ncbi:MAG: hypothetical protein AB8E15_06475 [Bdellovibrionales bacterium]